MDIITAFLHQPIRNDSADEDLQDQEQEIFEIDPEHKIDDFDDDFELENKEPSEDESLSDFEDQG